jgi:hypothetical protein
MIEYNAETKFTNHIPNVKIPASLLKSEDFKNTYTFAENMHYLTKMSLEYQHDRRAK